MPVRRKVFRIEQSFRTDSAAGLLDRAPLAPTERREILDALQALREAAHTTASSPVNVPADPDKRRRLGFETETILHALDATRQALAILHANGLGPPPARMARELDEVCAGAERATRQILDAAEAIDDAANTLSASLRRELEQSLAVDIRDHVLRIFEACNFQDLAGQRIARVQATLAVVEQQIAQMIDICGGVDALRPHLASVGLPTGPDRETMLHGPRLGDEDGHVSQAAIDAIFSQR